MRSWNAMAGRNLGQSRTRTGLSVLAVALGTAMIVATSVVGSGIRSAWGDGGNVMAWFEDLIDISLTSVGFVLFAAAGFLVFNAFAMSVTQRRRQLGALRCLGMTRRQVLQLVLVESLLIGGGGTLLGLVSGPLLGRGILAIARQSGVEIGPSQVSATHVVLAAVVGLGVSLLSALLPARRAARVSPLAALRTPMPVTRKERGTASMWIGLVLVVGLLTYLLIAPPGEWTGKNPPWEWIMVLLLWTVWLAALGCLVPTLVAGLVWVVRGPLCHLGGTGGRLMADNLGRAPRRVTLTVLAFAVGLALIIGMGGVITFNNDVLLARIAAKALQQTAWFVHPFDPSSGVAQLNAYREESLRLKPVVIEDVRGVAAGRAYVGESYMVQVPELGAPMPGFPSLIMDAQELQLAGASNLIEGDWETVAPLLEKGCGLLIPPVVAGRHEIEVGDTLTLQGRDGPVECVVAGIGAGGFIPMSIIGMGAKEAFVAADRPPDTLSVRPLPDTDPAALEADLRALVERHSGDAWLTVPEEEIGSILGTSDQLQGQFNGLVLLAEVTAALGMINTMMMNITERRREFGLLRAVGATRRQVTTVVMGEAALMGLIGALLGVIAGLGLGGIWALAYGGLTFSVTDLSLWKAAGEILLPALSSAWVGIVAAPLLAAAVTYPTIQAVLRGPVIETMEPARQL